MKIGIVGYQGSGKSSLFHWVTGQTPDPSLAHRTQSAMAEVPEPRVAALCEIYHPKKITLASLDVVDTPGLSRGHEGNAAKLAMIREAGCLVVVVAAYSGSPQADLTSFQDDLLMADLEIVSGRVERLRDALKRPRPNREEQEKELAALEPILKALEGGETLHGMNLSPDQDRFIRSFQLFSQKPRLVVFNVAEDESDPDRFLAELPPDVPGYAVSLGLQLELAQMDDAERSEFCQEMGVTMISRDALIRQMMDASHQMLFFTAGEKEVRTWMIRRGGTALEAADGIHSDLARGFIRAETIAIDDLLRLGSEREVKANNLLRREPKDYVIQDGDILNIQHNA